MSEVEYLGNVLPNHTLCAKNTCMPCIPTRAQEYMTSDMTGDAFQPGFRMATITRILLLIYFAICHACEPCVVPLALLCLVLLHHAP